MTINEYIDNVKKELDKFKEVWDKGVINDNYPEDLSLDEWYDQEESYRNM